MNFPLHVKEPQFESQTWRTSSVKCLCQINMQILFALVTPWEIRGQLKVPSAYLKSRKVNAYHFVPLHLTYSLSLIHPQHCYAPVCSPPQV